MSWYAIMHTLSKLPITHEYTCIYLLPSIDWNGESRMRPPVIADVGNPYNNVYKSGIGDWAQFARLIPTFSLRTPVERY